MHPYKQRYNTNGKCNFLFSYNYFHISSLFVHFTVSFERNISNRKKKNIYFVDNGLQSVMCKIQSILASTFFAPLRSCSPSTFHCHPVRNTYVSNSFNFFSPTNISNVLYSFVSGICIVFQLHNFYQTRRKKFTQQNNIRYFCNICLYILCDRWQVCCVPLRCFACTYIFRIECNTHDDGKPSSTQI